MRVSQLDGHTQILRGVGVIRKHKLDWMFVVLLIVIYGILNIIRPFHRFVGRDMMTDLKYPLKTNTVPFWTVPIFAVILPIIIFIAFYFYRRDVYDLHHAVLGLLLSVLITGVVTDSLKNATGRPRPDFFWRCFPDGIESYNENTGNVICHGKESEMRSGYKSFPSGHSSWSFAGLGFLSLYLLGKTREFDQGARVAKLCALFVPLFGATLVGVSLVNDYWHHWQDVVVGGLLGLIVCILSYLQFFPLPYVSEGRTATPREVETETTQVPAGTSEPSLPRSHDGYGTLNEMEEGRKKMEVKS